MSLAKFVWVVGAASAVLAAGAGVEACSSSSGSSSAQDSGSSSGDSSTASDTGSGSSSGGDSSSGADTSTGDSGAGEASCEKPPMLYAESTAGVYCPFSATDAGNVTCNAGQHCCETPAGGPPSTCEAIGTPCPVAGSVDWECEEAIDCMVDGGASGGPICCGSGTRTSATHCGVTWPEWSPFGGTKCMASCPAPGFIICEQNSDCTTDAGATCTATKANGNDFGFCGP